MCQETSQVCDHLRNNEVNPGECLTCHTNKGCPCNNNQNEIAVMNNGVYPPNT